jgi:hypothetical protein
MHLLRPREVPGEHGVIDRQQLGRVRSRQVLHDDTDNPLESECVQCEAGKYSTTVGLDSASTCIGCLPYSHSPNGSDVVVSCQCNTGYTGSDSGGGSACVPGRFKDAAGSASCTKCAPGSYLLTVCP